MSFLNFFLGEEACKNLIGIQDYFSKLMRQLPLKCVISKVECFILLCLRKTQDKYLQTVMRIEISQKAAENGENRD